MLETEVAMDEYKIGFFIGHSNSRYGGNKYDVIPGQILHHEGGCQNDRADTGFYVGINSRNRTRFAGNWMDGRLGYTCADLTPVVGWDDAVRSLVGAVFRFAGALRQGVLGRRFDEVEAISKGCE